MRAAEIGIGHGLNRAPAGLGGHDPKCLTLVHGKHRQAPDARVRASTVCAVITSFSLDNSGW